MKRPLLFYILFLLNLLKRKDEYMTKVNLDDNLSLFQGLFENSKYNMWIKDKEGNYLYINKPLKEMLESKGIDIMHKTDSEVLYDQEEAKAYLEQDEQVLKTGDILFNSYEVTPTVGKHSLVKAPIYDENGSIIATMGIAKRLTN